MEFVECKIQITCSKKFSVSEADYQKLFADAVSASPNFMAFDIDIDYDGRVGSTGAQFTKEDLADGDYSVKMISNSEFILEANCEIKTELMFMNDAGKTAFTKAIANNSINASICSVCNNGQNKKTFWSMECDPYIQLEPNELKIQPQ